MTQEQITKALKSSEPLQAIYDMPNLTSFEDYTPEELENMTYIFINPDDQNWQPGYETQLPEETTQYLVGSINIGTKSYNLYVY